jgi:hypothetical protein
MNYQHYYFINFSFTDILKLLHFFCNVGVHYAGRALKLDESDAEAHKWFAMTVGSRSEFLGTREKIEDGFLFKHHVDKALALQPNDPSLHHLMGRFKYEVSSLFFCLLGYLTVVYHLQKLCIT